MMNPAGIESFQSTQPINTKDSHSHLEELDYDINTSNNCLCFRSLSLPCFGQRRHNIENAHLLQQGQVGGGDQKPSYLQEKMKEVREWTEVVAGPKWKNLLRKLGAQFSGNNSNKKRCGRGAATPYDSFSYALNFDDGLRVDQEQENEAVHERFTRGFSVRYAAFPGPSSTAKSTS